MDKWRGRVVLVTGASSGIGAAVCENLVKNGMKVVGAARRIEKMQELEEKLKKEGVFMPVKCDVTKDEEVYALFNKIQETFGGVDVCVNNAGIVGTGLDLLNGTPEEWRRVADVNIIGVCLCSKLTVSSIRERDLNDGHIINISSIAAHTVFRIPPSHFFTATKFALRALSEGVRQELLSAKSDIKVSTVSPGLVKTEVFSHLRHDSEMGENMMELNTVLKAEDIAVTVSQILAAPSYLEVQDIIVTPRGKPFVNVKGESI